MGVHHHPGRDDHRLGAIMAMKAVVEWDYPPYAFGGRRSAEVVEPPTREGPEGYGPSLGEVR